MLKVTMLASLIAGLAMGTNIAASSQVKTIDKRDAEIIVEVDRESGLTEEGIANTQDIVMNNIRHYVTSNFRLITRYQEVANAFAISVSSNDIEQIKKVPGVKSVTLNQIHWETTTQDYSRSPDPEPEDEYGGSDNISAETMKKGDDTNDGEGTVVAILDNEFYFRAEHVENNVTVDSWHHETFSDLDPSTTVRYEGHPATWKTTYGYKQSKARGDLKDTDADMGKEGSLYFNRKIPYYYDYGGERSDYSIKYDDDLDVSSELTYHGSHVASITAGNAPTYKGIAPKAQLVCMKVFTNFKATGIGKLLGYSSSSGAYDIPIMNALEDCIKLKVDGINMSLGSNLNDFDSDTITCKTLTKLAQKGILTSISAGNSGKTSYQTTGGYANWTSEMVETGILSGYSNNPLATTVASGQPTKVFYDAAFQMGEDIVAYDDQIVNREYYGDEYEVEYKMAETLSEKYPEFGGNYPWVYVPGFGTSADYGTLEVDGKIAVVNRGSTSFSDKYAVAKSKGAIALVVINNDPTSNDFNFRMSFGDGFRPSMPCVLVLYKDKEKFADDKEGTLQIISKRLLDNDKAYSVSSFSSDGATFDLDLKPEITAPGDLIKGAVPPQKSEDRTEERKYKVYEFLSGTSMSAPNHAGAQSVVLSRFAKDYVAEVAAIDADSTKTDAEKKTAKNQALAAFEAKRATVDMRLQSTAEPMFDLKNNPETDELNYTSPRRQGAGMVDLGDAYRTDIYLEGLDLQGNKTGKSKIALRNSEKINNGVVNLKFVAHNESETTHTYSATLTVMRPAIAKANAIVTKEYNYKGEVDAISGFPGYVYYIKNSIEGQEPTRNESFGVADPNDVYYVNRDIEYYASAEDCKAGIKTTIYKNRYYNAGTAAQPEWKVLPSKDYQSVQDVVLAKVTLADVVIPAGETTIQLAEYTLTAEQKADIAAFYDYGCYIEGYVELVDKDGESANLGLPFMGFYAGEGKDYGDAPVYEPFSFEKNGTTVYPSDLVNDIAKSLIGKDKADMGSLWVAGYVKEGDSVNTNDILANDDNFANLSGFHLLGTNPNTESLYESPENNLYVGNSYYTNTMIVQQFMLRSCANNFFTVTNKATGEVAYKSALEDMLFGDDDFGRYALYKSHIDDSYLGAGYVSHRAYAVIPLYDENGIPFASGEYTISFNYLLSSTGEWVNYDYTLHIDSDSPEVRSITEEGDNIRINIKEKNLVSLSIDKDLIDIDSNDGFVRVDEENCYFELSKDAVEQYLEARMNYYQGSGRLIIRLKDAAYGSMGVIVRFEYDDNDNIIWSSYVMVEHHELSLQHDFEDDGVNVQVVKYNSSTSSETPVDDLEGYVLVSRGPVTDKITITVNGCAGNITTTSILLSALALIGLVGVAFNKIKRKEVLGGND